LFRNVKEGGWNTNRSKQKERGKCAETVWLKEFEIVDLSGKKKTGAEKISKEES